jgi:hypothetical protein
MFACNRLDYIFDNEPKDSDVYIDIIFNIASTAGDDEPIQKINMDDYKAEVMRTFNLTTDEEYKKWVLAGNKLSPAPKRRSPTMYSERVKHAFGLTDEEWQRKVASGELLFRPSENYEDEDAQAKF